MLLCVRTQMSNKHLQKIHGFDEKKYRKHIDLMKKKRTSVPKKNWEKKTSSIHITAIILTRNSLLHPMYFIPFPPLSSLFGAKVKPLVSWKEPDQVYYSSIVREDVRLSPVWAWMSGNIYRPFHYHFKTCPHDLR